MIARMRHRLAHWFGWNGGRVETFWRGNTLMVGLRCSCGELMDVTECQAAMERVGYEGRVLPVECVQWGPM